MQIEQPQRHLLDDLENRISKSVLQQTQLYNIRDINVKKILAVINATYAVAKRKPEKIRLAGIRTLSSAIPVQRSNQLS